MDALLVHLFILFGFLIGLCILTHNFTKTLANICTLCINKILSLVTPVKVHIAS